MQRTPVVKFIYTAVNAYLYVQVLVLVQAVGQVLVQAVAQVLVQAVAPEGSRRFSFTLSLIKGFFEAFFRLISPLSHVDVSDSL